MILSTIRPNLLAFVLGLAAAVFLVISVVQSVKLNGFLGFDGALDRVERLDRDNRELRAELKAISDAKDKQRAETEKRIDKAEQGNREAEKRAERIENAPLPGNCLSPPEILGADI